MSLENQPNPLGQPQEQYVVPIANPASPDAPTVSVTRQSLHSLKELLLESLQALGVDNVHYCGPTQSWSSGLERLAEDLEQALRDKLKARLTGRDRLIEAQSKRIAELEAEVGGLRDKYEAATQLLSGYSADCGSAFQTIPGEYRRAVRDPATDGCAEGGLNLPASVLESVNAMVAGFIDKEEQLSAVTAFVSSLPDNVRHWVRSDRDAFDIPVVPSLVASLRNVVGFRHSHKKSYTKPKVDVYLSLLELIAKHPELKPLTFEVAMKFTGWASELMARAAEHEAAAFHYAHSTTLDAFEWIAKATISASERQQEIAARTAEVKAATPAETDQKQDSLNNL